MIKKIFFILLFSAVLNAQVKHLGENLFNGEFIKSTHQMFNENYKIQIGDNILLQIWGAFNFNKEIIVDKNGNIFIPDIGIVHLKGVLNKNLNKRITTIMKKNYKDNVFSYATLNNNQPITLFVTGHVKKPGIYLGEPTDNILTFIDKAKGLTEVGGYRNIDLIRDNKVIKKYDLYDFLYNVKTNLTQLRNKDMIRVNSIDSFFTIKEMTTTTLIEINKKHVTTLKTLELYLNLKYYTDVIIEREIEGMKKYIRKNLKKDKNFLIKTKDKIKLIKDTKTNDMVVSINGEHNTINTLILQKGTTLRELLNKIKLNNLSNLKGLSLYRKSNILVQKDLLEKKLNLLEEKILTTNSETVEETKIRTEETKLLSKFIEKARRVEFKGQVILVDSTVYSNIYLEDGDTINIPRKTNMLNIAGAVKLPTNIPIKHTYGLKDYIKLTGGFTQNADKDNILLIKPSGKIQTIKYSSNVKLEGGDKLLILTEVDNKTFTLFKEVTQIIYHLAVGAGVILRAY